MSETSVAIIVPTMNRPEFVERTVRYYCDINSPHPIYIGDASSESQEPKINEWIKDSSLVVHYNHWPQLNDRKTLIALAKAAKEDGEQYVAFHGDDDLFVPESLSKCAIFLELNSEYATAQGKAALVILDRSGPYGHIEEIGKYWEKEELNGETPLERLDEMLQSYFVAQFSVHRLEEFLDSSKIYENIPCSHWGEIYQCLSFAIQGKSKHLNVLYLMRHVHVGRTTVAGKPRAKSFLEWIGTPTWYPSFQLTCEDIVRQLNDPHISLPVIQDRMNAHFEMNLRKKFLKSESNFFCDIKNIIKFKFPALLSFKRLLGLRLKSSDDLALLTNPKSKFFHDFLLIHQAFALKQNRAISSD